MNTTTNATKMLLTPREAAAVRLVTWCPLLVTVLGSTPIVARVGNNFCVKKPRQAPRY